MEFSRMLALSSSLVRLALATALFSSVIPSSVLAGERICPQPWENATGTDCVRLKHTMPLRSHRGGTDSVTATIRSGFLRENPLVPFRGNLIFYEGLGDSMINHLPLFSELTAVGYRVISFDYMGQGGSSGDMNDTRIRQISVLGDQVWRREAREIERFPKKTIIGWSTGGLAAYTEAIMNPERVDSIVLIAPGIAPNPFVGEQHPLRGKLNLITLRTLTTADYSKGQPNPHLDPIFPTSPMKVLTGFALDLMKTARTMRSMPFSPDVRGFVLLSGKKDTYVDAAKTLKVLKANVPRFGDRFSAKIYPLALHEIDNEAEPTRSEAHTDIVDFLLRTR